MSFFTVLAGDSAKAFAVAGLSVIGREYYGVIPVRGKPLNVREATPKQILENAEFNMIKTVLGLKQGVSYKDTKALRYSRVCILTDAVRQFYYISAIFTFYLSSILTYGNDVVCRMLTDRISKDY